MASVGHTGAHIPVTLEGQIIRIVDRIAYLCHDFDDAQRLGMLTVEELPFEVREHFGMTPSSMITAMVVKIWCGSLWINLLFLCLVIWK